MAENNQPAPHQPGGVPKPLAFNRQQLPLHLIHQGHPPPVFDIVRCHFCTVLFNRQFQLQFQDYQQFSNLHICQRCGIINKLIDIEADLNVPQLISNFEMQNIHQIYLENELLFLGDLLRRSRDHDVTYTINMTDIRHYTVFDTYQFINENQELKRKRLNKASSDFLTRIVAGCSCYRFANYSNSYTNQKYIYKFHCSNDVGYKKESRIPEQDRKRIRNKGFKGQSCDSSSSLVIHKDFSAILNFKHKAHRYVCSVDYVSKDLKNAISEFIASKDSAMKLNEDRIYQLFCRNDEFKDFLECTNPKDLKYLIKSLQKEAAKEKSDEEKQQKKRQLEP